MSEKCVFLSSQGSEIHNEIFCQGKRDIPCFPKFVAVYRFFTKSKSLYFVADEGSQTVPIPMSIGTGSALGIKRESGVKPELSPQLSVCLSDLSERKKFLLHNAIVPHTRDEKAGKNQMSQETCLDLLILCFRRKSEEDVSISLQINFSTG